jgi:hypothetical protein
MDIELSAALGLAKSQQAIKTSFGKTVVNRRLPNLISHARCLRQLYT